MRDSDLIRKLLASGMNYRSAAKIAKCSTGAISAEVRAMKAEAKKRAEQEALEPKLEFDLSPNTHQGSGAFHLGQGRNFDFSNSSNELTFELEK